LTVKLIITTGTAAIVCSGCSLFSNLLFYSLPFFVLQVGEWFMDIEAENMKMFLKALNLLKDMYKEDTTAIPIKQLRSLLDHYGLTLIS